MDGGTVGRSARSEQGNHPAIHMTLTLPFCFALADGAGPTFAAKRPGSDIGAACESCLDLINPGTEF